MKDWEERGFGVPGRIRQTIAKKKIGGISFPRTTAACPWHWSSFIFHPESILTLEQKPGQGLIENIFTEYPGRHLPLTQKEGATA